MSVSRRQLLRLLRLRNLLMLTFIVILLYVVKLLTNMEANDQYTNQTLQILQMPQGFLQKRDVFVPSTLKKIDWHDYVLIEQERKRVGIGEQGLPAHLPKSHAEIEKELYATNGFNAALSDLIPLNRSLPDIRYHTCEKKLYIASLPTVSVVVPFHNEHWSTLLRTAYSVLLRSPETLIKEVFLVDDASTKDFLKENLDEYLAKNMPKVKVVRLEERSGLITARLAGAKQATGDVLLFLDSHTEANVNWLPPLLEPIALNYRTVTCPYIDVIAFDTFEYRAQDEGARGAFDWEFFYKRLPILPKDEENMPEPFESPVMAGGLFAISRKFFWELGGYDPGLDIWGGEQYELSFKIWQCGGRMVDTPCSRVGHIYRKFAPFPNPGHGDFVGRPLFWVQYFKTGNTITYSCSGSHFGLSFKTTLGNVDVLLLARYKNGIYVQNYRRVAEVWMDEYAQYLYARRPHYLKIDPGDLTEQKELRERLHCKPFRWFMTQIAFDLTAKYPTVEPKPFAQGRVRPVSNPKMCIDAHHGDQMDKLQIKPCVTTPDAEQEFILSWHKDIRVKTRNICWDLPESANKSPIRLFSCHLGGGNQLWRYRMDTKQIKHGSEDHCVDWSPSTRDLYINQCDTNRGTQRWTIDKIDKVMMAKWPSMRNRVTGPIEKA